MQKLISLLSLATLLALMSCGDSASTSPAASSSSSDGGSSSSTDLSSSSSDALVGDAYAGGLVWDNWTKNASGGSDSLPTGAVNKDFLRCKACHGWDAMGDAGGYVRRSAKDTRPNAAVEGTNLTGLTATEEMVVDPEGRAFSVEDSTMPNFTAEGGLTAQQAADVMAFLNDGPKISDVATLDITADPVTYTFTNAVVATGGTLYASKCSECHDSQINTDILGTSIMVDGKNGIGDYIDGDGKYSELFSKIVYGIPGSEMTRVAIGNLTAEEARDILAYIQANNGAGQKFPDTATVE